MSSSFTVHFYFFLLFYHATNPYGKVKTIDYDPWIRTNKLMYFIAHGNIYQMSSNFRYFPRETRNYIGSWVEFELAGEFCCPQRCACLVFFLVYLFDFHVMLFSDSSMTFTYLLCLTSDHDCNLQHVDIFEL